MGKYIHLAREFYSESDMRALFSADTYFTVTRLYKIARSRGLILSDSLSRESLINELSRLSYSWSQFQDAVKHMSDDKVEEDKGAALRVQNKLDYDEIAKAKDLLENKRSEKHESYSIQKLSDSKVQIFVRYTELDPTRSKGFSKQEKTSVVEIDLAKNQAEIIHSKDDRSMEIANQLLSCLRVGRKNPDELVEKTIALPANSSAEAKTQFFLDLINSIRGCVLQKVKDVKLEQFKLREDDPLEDEADSEQAEEDAAALRKLEKEAAGKIQSAMLHGDNVLETEFYKQLSKDGYFISFIRWEVRQTGQTERRIVLEAGFTDPQKSKRFYFEAKKYYDKDDFGDDKLTAKNTKALDRAKFRRLIVDAAFTILEKPNQPQGKKTP